MNNVLEASHHDSEEPYFVLIHKKDLKTSHILETVVVEESASERFDLLKFAGISSYKVVSDLVGVIGLTLSLASHWVSYLVVLFIS